MTTIFEISIWNFQELIKESVPTKLIYRNFDFGDPRSGQFWDLTAIRQWENVHMPPFPKVRVAKCYLSQYILTLGHSRWPVSSFDPMTPPSGHLRSYEVTFAFLPLPFDRIEIEHWGWFQYASLAQTHRLICNMMYLSRHLTSHDLDLRSNSDIDLLRSIMYIIRRVSTRGTWCCQNYVTIFHS